jgi:hypothetical protein
MTTIKGHLSSVELETRYEAAADGSPRAIFMRSCRGRPCVVPIGCVMIQSFTTRGWLLRHYDPVSPGAARGHAAASEHQGVSLMGLGKRGDCGSTSPRSLDELAQLRTHTAHYSPVMIALLSINSSACRLPT